MKCDTLCEPPLLDIQSAFTVGGLDMHIDGGGVDWVSATPVNWLQGGW
jgi:hypothetical protein